MRKTPVILEEKKKAKWERFAKLMFETYKRYVAGLPVKDRLEELIRMMEEIKKDEEKG